jgi:hypothetical protein
LVLALRSVLERLGLLSVQHVFLVLLVALPVFLGVVLLLRVTLFLPLLQ